MQSTGEEVSEKLQQAKLRQVVGAGHREMSGMVRGDIGADKLERAPRSGTEAREEETCKGVDVKGWLQPLRSRVAYDCLRWLSCATISTAPLWAPQARVFLLCPSVSPRTLPHTPTLHQYFFKPPIPTYPHPHASPSPHIPQFTCTHC